MMIDGKAVHKYLFARYSRQSNHPELAQVEAHDKDHAVRRLAELYPRYNVKEWEFIEELDAEHDVGMLGRKHPLGVIIRPDSAPRAFFAIPRDLFLRRLRSRH